MSGKMTTPVTKQKNNFMVIDYGQLIHLKQTSVKKHLERHLAHTPQPQLQVNDCMTIGVI
jgi:hypothetical protein